MNNEIQFSELPIRYFFKYNQKTYVKTQHFLLPFLSFSYQAVPLDGGKCGRFDGNELIEPIQLGYNFASIERKYGEVEYI